MGSELLNEEAATPPLVILSLEILSNDAKNLLKNLNIIAQIMSELYHTIVNLWFQSKNKWVQ